MRRNVVDIDLDAVHQLLHTILHTVLIVERAQQIHDQNPDELVVHGLARTLAPLQPMVGGLEQADEVLAQPRVDQTVLLAHALHQPPHVVDEEAPRQELVLARHVVEERERGRERDPLAVGQMEEVVYDLDPLVDVKGVVVEEQVLHEHLPVLRVVVEAE